MNPKKMRLLPREVALQVVQDEEVRPAVRAAVAHQVAAAAHPVEVALAALLEVAAEVPQEAALLEEVVAPAVPQEAALPVVAAAPREVAVRVVLQEAAVPEALHAVAAPQVKAALQRAVLVAHRKAALVALHVASRAVHQNVDRLDDELTQRCFRSGDSPFRIDGRAELRQRAPTESLRP
jgi:hypothetical protein